MSYDRLRSAWRQAWRKEESAQWVYGLVGKGTADDPVFVPTGLPDHLYVRVRNASGSQTTPPARNDAGVGQSFGLPVRMYYEGAKLVIDGVSRRPDLATAEPPSPSGVPVHIHDDRYFTAAEHIAVSAGAADAAKPVVLGATGLLSNTFLDVELASIAALTSAADRLPYYTGLGTASLATFTAFARSFLDDVDAAAVRSTLGLIIGTNVQAYHANLAALSGLTGAADRSVYFTGAGALALYTLSAYGRTLAALADAAAGRTALGLVAGAAGDIWVEKAGDAMAGNLDMGGSYFIVNLADPSNAQDAATKAYVDAVAQGLDLKLSVRAATTANITLSGTQTIDGVSVIAGDRVLVKDQSTGANNGIYVAAAGAWSRATDANVSSEVTSGMYTFVSEGTVNGNVGFALVTDDPITLDTTALVFTPVVNAANVGAAIDAAAEQTTLEDANRIALVDDGVLKWSLWSTIKAALLTYFTTLFVLLAGKAGGQTINGGTASGENLTLHSTAHATKGKILLGASSGYDGANVRLGIGTPSPAVFVHAQGSGTGGGDVNQTIIRAENTAAGGAPAIHVKNDQAVRVQFVAFGSTFAGSTFGVTRAGKAYLTFNGSTGGLYVGTETDQDVGIAVNDVLRAILSSAVSLSVIQPTLGSAVLELVSTATNDDTRATTYQNRIATTGATPTTLHTFAIPASNTVLIEVIVIARRTGGASGTADDGAAYSMKATYTTKAGVVTLLGGAPLEYIDNEDVAGWDCDLVISGTNVIVQVTGATTTNITWHMIEGRLSKVGT